MKTKKLEDTSEWITDKNLTEGTWIHYKGHNIPKETLIKELEKDWLGYIYREKDCEEEIIVLETKEDYYYCKRFFEGEDAREAGYTHWIEFTDNKKKTYGKSTNVHFKIKEKQDNRSENNEIR